MEAPIGGGSAGGSQTAFVYSSEPQAVPSKRSKNRAMYREQHDLEEGDLLGSNNIMFDRRVVRGNTYAAQVITQSAQKEAERLRSDHQKRMLMEALRRRQEAELAMMPRTPPAVPGRLHMEMQTEDLLEEITDRPIETEAETQTDPFADRPPSPLFVPAKSGVDADTQVDVGELFDFDQEVEPILEVLVGKTLELSVLELMQEEELEAIRRRQEAFTEQRNAELAEVQRMEAEAKRKFAEKQRRLKQAQEAKKARAELLEKVAARSFSRSYLVNLNEDVFDQLETEGHFYDPMQKEIKEEFLPWVMEEMEKGVQVAVDALEVTNLLISASLEKAKDAQEAAAKAKEEDTARLAKERAEEEARRIKEAEEKAAAEAEAAAKAAKEAEEAE